MRLVAVTPEGRTENPRFVRVGEPVSLMVPLRMAVSPGTVVDIVGVRPDSRTWLLGTRRLEPPDAGGGDVEVPLKPFGDPGQHVLRVEVGGVQRDERLVVEVVGMANGRVTAVRKRYKGR